MRPVSIDFYNNYMTNFHDNPFETDGGMHNIRVLRNMMINSASHAFCNQPSIGGPIYWIGNIAYHLPGRIDQAHERVGGRALLPQHDSFRDRRRGHVERALAQQPLPRRERGAGDLQRQQLHQLQFVGLQRVPSQPDNPVDPVDPVDRCLRVGGTGGWRALRLHRPGPPRRARSRKFKTLVRTAPPRARTRTACWWTTTCS